MILWTKKVLCIDVIIVKGKNLIFQDQISLKSCKSKYVSVYEWKKMVSSRLDFQVISLHLWQKACSQGPLKFLLLLSFNTFALWSLFKGMHREVEWPFNEYFYYLVFTGNALKFIFLDFVLFSSLPFLHLHFQKAVDVSQIFSKIFQFIFLTAWERRCF